MWILCSHTYQIIINNLEKIRLDKRINRIKEIKRRRIRETIIRIMGKRKREIKKE